MVHILQTDLEYLSHLLSDFSNGLKHCCGNLTSFKDRLWVSKHDHPWVRVFVGISLVPYHILNHDTSLKS